MKHHLSRMLFHRDIHSYDFVRIRENYVNDENGLEECFRQIDDELKTIARCLSSAGKACEYEPLSSTGFRKVKMFSSKEMRSTQGAKPDLRIVYRYNATKDKIEVLAIGFRIKERPRPPEDVYSISAARDFVFR